MADWHCALELDESRRPTAGSADALLVALNNAADLRIATAFRHNEHIDTSADSDELIEEVAEFGVTYVVDGRWAAGIMSLRQPVDLPVGFGPRPSMSFFMYNQNGEQAIARPYLDRLLTPGWARWTVMKARSQGLLKGPSRPSAPENMPRYHALDNWDALSNAPSHNFVYDFDHFRFCVRDDWLEVGYEELVEAFREGCAIKIGVRGLCDDLVPQGEAPLPHEVFVQTGSAYHYTGQRLLMVGSHPVVRVRPAIPMRYATDNWDFGWLFVRTDGRVVYRRCDPYTLQFDDCAMQCAVRWFVR
ncbi:MAG: hypothetical protein KKI08_27480 [Armatimonadetes bacterium]|nr:hypothetical protein [Armatimonadota bacterium]